MSDENPANNTSTPPPAAQAPDAPAAQASQQFGGAPVEPTAPPKKKKSNALRISCLVGVLAIAVFFVLFVISFISALGKILEGEELPTMPTMSASSKTIALLKIDEPIFEGQKFIAVLDHYIAERDIRAVLVRINSPGGTVGASQELYDGLLKLREQGKKVVVSMASVAASGGYYTACAADKIYTNPGAMTGSIGVIMSVPRLDGLAEKVGVGMTVVQSGKYKNVPSTLRQLTDEEKKLLQDLIQDTHEQFVEAILDARGAQLNEAFLKLSPREIAELLNEDTTGIVDGESLLRHVADGRILTGRQARRLGLVDELGGKQEAIEALAKMAGIKGRPELYEFKPRRSIFEMFEAGASSAVKSLPLPIQGARLEYRMPF